MTNKEYIAELSKQSGRPIKETATLVATLFADISQHLQEGKTVTIPDFGSFEVRKKAERIYINPITKKRMLVPPKLVLTYEPSTTLTDKFK